MANLQIRTPNTSSLAIGQEMVYAGKSGYSTLIGAVPILCTSYTANSSSIVFNVSNVHLLTDDNFNTNILNVPDLLGLPKSYLKADILQYEESTQAAGAAGYTSQLAPATLEIRNFNLTANTITTNNYVTGALLISNQLTTPPFYITLFQTIKANNFASNSFYVHGSEVSTTRTSNIIGTSGTYTHSLGVTPSTRNDIDVFIDDIKTESYSWPASGNAANIALSLPGLDTTLETRTRSYTVPAIERGDSVSLSTFNNVFTITNTSYQISDASYNANLTNNRYYRIKLSKPISSDAIGSTLYNISRDLTGTVSAVTDSNFTIQYDERNYPFTYELANNKVYYLYQKDKIKFTTARLDEYGKLSSVDTKYYLVEATNINRFNRISNTVKKLIKIDPIKIAKVSQIDISELIFIDTTGGASITATIFFPPVLGRDITDYEIKYRVVSTETSTLPEYATTFIPQNETVPLLRCAINNLNRGRAAGTNTLEVIVTPLNGQYRGFETRFSQSLVGKTDFPAGLSNLNVAQQGLQIIFSWQFATTADGYILDLDTKEVEIREYPGSIDISDSETLDAAWSISLVVDRIPFPNTTFNTPVSKFGNYTYLLRVRDTSNQESTKVVGAVLQLIRPTDVRIYKAYNEGAPGISFSTQDNIPFPTSNTDPEVSFPSFSSAVNGGFVKNASSNADNSNASSFGFSAYGGTGFLTTGNQTTAQYVTQIRDIGRVIRGTLRIAPTVSIASPNITYVTQYNSFFSGVSDFHGTIGRAVTSNVLVDTAFGGIGHILGFDNSNAATVTYNSFHRTLTSGGEYGNVYMIRRAESFTGDIANANSYAKIAGVINGNAIALGEVFHSNGEPTGGNTFANVTISGNSYQLIDVTQFGDPGGGFTYLGPDRSISQNLFIRYSTDNVYYSGASNGVAGYPGHGNTNPYAFTGAATNAELGYKNYIAGELDFRYFQIKLEVINKKPLQSSLILENLTYEVDVREKTFRKVINVNSTTGVVVDYSYVGFVENPTIAATIISTESGHSVLVSNVSTGYCNVVVFNTQNGNFVSPHTVNITAVGV
jgi:hypothetical protein